MRWRPTSAADITVSEACFPLYVPKRGRRIGVGQRALVQWDAACLRLQSALFYQLRVCIADSLQDIGHEGLQILLSNFDH